MDTLDPAARSERMRRVRGKNTRPEMVVRRLAHRLGYRFRLHRRDLPGSPDLVFPGRRAVIFVHGCFWHQHDCSRGARRPSNNAAYWHPKLARNVERDREARQRLESEGWRVLVLWECEMRNSEQLSRRLTGFLDP
ncbi:DNA mismatch endonuclease Vsr (plasmid) [Sphingomonas naphthae]|uniref:Very short patch repair endonuclease n=1 Tax=Sphingomonas naphthae TaxID=1813468 RepID=A0ABY7TTC8_9SPHN|nr:DNA mismatch endonuclease Vsr [Sphingomonas naphthae]WCT75866.1 DNA mismatch endonuclease Vsr [Sphingomonas naphthae]